MSSAISMNVRGLVTVRAGRMLNMTAGITVVIRGGFPCCGFGGGDKRCLKGERQHRHHHDDGAHTSSKRLRNASQLCASAIVHNINLHQIADDETGRDRHGPDDPAGERPASETLTTHMPDVRHQHRHCAGEASGYRQSGPRWV